MSLRITINAAMTADGKIATTCGDSRISSRLDLLRVHELRSSFDAILVGISTVLVDDPLLTVRLIKPNRRSDPVRLVVDSQARIPIESRILKTAHRIETIVFVSERANDIKIRSVRSTGAMVIIAGTETVDLSDALLYLKKMGFKNILVEGGGEINWSLLSLGVVSELIVTISPKIVGGRSATTLVEGDGYEKISQAINMELKKVLREKNGELVLFYEL
ncbi:MAG TPA: 2,5-diamino-6-(ribosylamino)-4(3H)-pyrimidinone 5'-phosphate reductase [Candidatus Bathyarchaeia archaeon]|nr:2,5-diamino-6-(ribosylamino)-4(3H)-pyrimidinone 5'-phosphate reductase [Candidatus Bathyarchaeia archaeon]